MANTQYQQRREVLSSTLLNGKRLTNFLIIIISSVLIGLAIYERQRFLSFRNKFWQKINYLHGVFREKAVLKQDDFKIQFPYSHSFEFSNLGKQPNIITELLANSEYNRLVEEFRHRKKSQEWRLVLYVFILTLVFVFMEISKSTLIQEIFSPPESLAMLSHVLVAPRAVVACLRGGLSAGITNNMHVRRV